MVRPGDLFAGVPGRSGHGARFAADAIAAGAVAVLTDAEGRSLVPAGVPVLTVPDVRAALGEVSSTVYGRPSEAMNVLGVTGTSGKTTTTFLIRAGLLAAGRVPGLIGTVATMIGDEEIKTGFTTPEAPEVQALLAVMRERGVTDVAMEVSSHALALGRAAGIEFAAGAFTNLSEDHLDFHADMADYFAAKARLFGAHTRRSVVVLDDEWGRRMADTIHADVTVATSAAAGDPGDLDGARDRTSCPAAAPGSRSTVRTFEVAGGCAVPGRYNVANALLAVALLHEVGVPADVSRAGRRGRVGAGPDGAHRRRAAVPRDRRLQPQAGRGRRCAAGAPPAHRPAS